MRPLNAPDWLIARPIAHRGLHNAEEGVIENTLAAAHAAIAHGFAIECDAQTSRDGEAFVFHDFTLDRLTDAKGALSEMSAAAIRKVRIVERAPSPLAGEGWGGGSRELSQASLLPARGEKARMRGRRERPLSQSPCPSPRPSPREAGRQGRDRIPSFAELLALVAGRTPIVCELKSRFDRDFRIADHIAALARAYEGPLAFKSFDPDLVAYLRLRWPSLGPPGRPCPLGVVAEASYDGPDWEALSAGQKRDWPTFEHFDRARPDFLSWNVDDLPHATPFFVREFQGAPVMAWTVRRAAQREAARKWADQIVFEGDGRP